MRGMGDMMPKVGGAVPNMGDFRELWQREKGVFVVFVSAIVRNVVWQPDPARKPPSDSHELSHSCE